MILKAAIKLTVVFQGSAWCRQCAAPIISNGNIPHSTAFFFCFHFSNTYNFVSFTIFKYFSIVFHIFTQVALKPFPLFSEISHLSLVLVVT